MPFDTSGTFNRVIPGGWQADAAAGTKITAVRHDAEDDGFAKGLSDCITKHGYTQPLANIPFNNKKIINLGEPDNPSDAATKNYVDNFKSFGTGLSINGAGPINGFINFSSPTGVNGIGWTTADMSWVGELEEAAKYSKRLVVNDKKDGTGTDVAFIDERGMVYNNGQFSYNLSWDGAAWRTIAAGSGNLISNVGGALLLSSNDTATTSAFQSTTLREYFRALNSVGTTQLRLMKSASGKEVAIYGMVGTQLRWNMQLGNTAAESATYKGSNFVITHYDNAGGAGRTSMQIDRETNDTYFYGDVRASSQFYTTSTSCILAAANGGAVYLRPNGPTSGTEQCYVSTVGDWHVSQGHLFIDSTSTRGVYAGMGQQGRNGTTGGYTGYWHNWVHSAGLTYVLVNSTNFGAIQMVCDYRTKRNVEELPPTWEMIKKLHPIRYQYKAFEGLEGDKDDDEVRWGFVAHELQGTLTKSAASFEKDAPNAVQSPNLMVIVAALTKALQEAMQRIEALEAAQNAA